MFHVFNQRFGAIMYPQNQRVRLCSKYFLNDDEPEQKTLKVMYPWVSILHVPFGRTPACGKTACFVILGLSLQGTSQLASKKLTLIQKMDALQMISYCYHIVLYDVLHVYIERYLVFLL